ncbi:short-chain dehydrogenase reductase 3a-like [Rhododendron vialii]|uniref:short-chain dehydrogenase reductase 3a-like n=1 Tax=Rhododendron vialii TaxID=182163 RepID=UPI002660279C|nr:short-chain dehydrogenase reductase 3a-like [Rhododendron vialii]
MSKPRRLEGKVAIITGAASGIGEAAAKLFVENGAFVVVADIQEELGLKVVASIAGPDVDRAIYKKCDVTVEKQVEETVAFAIEKFGTLDIMYSNAGIMGSWESILDMDMEEGFDRTMAVNLRGPALCIKHAARAMVKRQVRGSIICTASSASVIGGLGTAGYIAAKHGLVGLVRAAASELGKHGIRVNCVSPYFVPTPMGISWSLALGMDNVSAIEAVASTAANLKGVELKAKDIAEAALFLASDESSIYVSGHNLAVDGGFTVVDNSITMMVSQMLMKEKQY